MAHRPGDLTVVALSGGVDSATAAGLLVEAGERVVAIAMRLYDARGTSASVGGRCCGPRDLEDARQVAAHLGIPFYVASYTAEFQRAVIDDFVSEYGEGRTPNPCVRCNQYIKFTPLWRRARALGATSLATGHYARIVRSSDGSGPLLARAVDAEKDQSYFLFGMPRAALGYVRFPIGELLKSEVRAHARRLGLPNADKGESQEICFVPDGDHAAFVARHLPAPPPAGEIVDEETGVVVGRHDGVHRYTIGQRRGLGSLAPAHAGDRPAARYVVALDARAGRVTVGDAGALGRRGCFVDDVVWWPDGSAPPAAPLDVSVQIRHRHPPRRARVLPLDGGRARVDFAEPERAVAPGQAAVFYDGPRIVGGGFISDRRETRDQEASTWPANA